MSIVTASAQASIPMQGSRMVVDCRSIDFGLAAGESPEALLSWVMSFPRPAAMHVVLPSSAPGVRRLQCTLQGLGCRVSRVTKCLPGRSYSPHV